MLSFVTRAPTPSNGWATVMIMYIDNNPATPERGLTVRYLAYGSGEGAPWLQFSNNLSRQTQDSQLRRISKLPVAYQLDDRVVGMRVEYLDRNAKRWLSDRSASRGGGGGNNWQAVRITLEGAQGTPLPPLLQLPFYITQSVNLAMRE